MSIVLCFQEKSQAQDFRWDLEWYNSASKVEKKEDNLLDPSGRRLKSADQSFESDLRWNTKWTGKNKRLVVRPRILGSFNQYQYTQPSESLSDSTAEVTTPEAYIEVDASKRWTWAAGLQNYQWGPAELISPSNPFYHFNSEQTDYNYRENGRALLRMNYSPNDRWSFVALIEPANNGRTFWIEEQQFEPQAALKIERRGKNSLNYMGIDGGVVHGNLPFLGEYANLEIFKGISAYFDARQTVGSAQYEPVQDAFGLYDMVYVEDRSTLNSLSVVGLRWETSVDFRLEYIYNSYGLKPEERNNAFSSAVPVHPRGDRNLKRLGASGMELLGDNYGYASLRFPDYLGQNNNLFLRYIQSLSDQSAYAQIATDIALADAWTLFAEVSATIGDNTQELSGREEARGLLGLKWNL